MIVKANSGHKLYVQKVLYEQLPENVKSFQCMNRGDSAYYIIRNWDKDGVVFMYIAKHKKQYVVWYKNGNFWSSFGTTIEKAINGAQRDGWMYV